MFPRQKPRNATPEALKKWEEAKLEWWSKNKDPSAWPWSVVRQFQAQHALLQTGSRELQNWRIQQFLAQKPTLYSFKRKIVYKKEGLPLFTLLEVPPPKISVDRKNTFLDVPKDVIQNHILIYLKDDPVALFALMMSCRSMQAICHKLLFALSQERFGPLGTPKAIMCAAFYESSLPHTRLKKKRKTDGEDLPLEEQFSRERLKEKLNLFTRDFKSSRVVASDVDSLIKASIQKNGCIDNLSVIWNAKAQQTEAKKIEDAFIQTHMSARINEVNVYLAQKGYQGLTVRLSETNNHVVWGNDCILPILTLFECNNDYSARRFLHNVEEYVFMQTERSVQAATSSVRFMQPSFFNIAFVNMNGNAEPFFPLLYLVVQMLLEIKLRGYVFYDRVMTEQEWNSRLAYLFSPECRLAHRDFPGSGSYVCFWPNSDTRVVVRCLSQMQHQPSLQHYYQWLRPWDPGFHLRLASPATGQCYGNFIPGHYVAQGKVVYLAHCLMTNKN